jgi:hypothetical protein
MMSEGGSDGMQSSAMGNQAITRTIAQRERGERTQRA